MAFYEMLPGAGMPPGLQAGMDSVLNKKFGTSTTYPAEGWPDTVNLMGPLPEKTASGTIVTFADGADDVPLKKCEITLPASLNGYSSVDVVVTGKNVFDMDNINQISYYDNLVSGYWYTDKIVLTPNTTYTISPSATASLGVGDYFVLYINPDPSDPDYLVITNPSVKYVVSAGNPMTVTFTTGNTGVIRFGITSYAAQPKQSAFDAFLSIGYQIEVGSTASTFEPYSGTTHTASLGRTIYGGTVDVVKGQGTSTHGLYTFTGNEVYVQQTNQVAVKVAFTVGSSYQTGLDTAISAVEDFVAGGCGASNYLYVKTTMTAENLKTYMANHTVSFAYVLATPETFTFYPISIDSKLGNNTIWSEQGDTEVTYRADINLALGGN